MKFFSKFKIGTRIYVMFGILIVFLVQMGYSGISNRSQMIHDSQVMMAELAVAERAIEGDAGRASLDRIGAMLTEDIASMTAANSFLVWQIVLGLIFVVILSVLVVRSITRPVQNLLEASEGVAKGHLNVNFDTSSNDEISIIAKRFSDVVGSVNAILYDVSEMYNKHEEGHMSHMIDVSRFQGSYREVAVGINAMAQSYVDMVKDILKVLNHIADGNLEVYLNKYHGEKAAMNSDMGRVRETLRKVVGDIGLLVDAASGGELSAHVDISGYKGSWRVLVDGLNKVLENVAKPIEEMKKVMGEMSHGMFDMKVQGDYKGDFASIKDSLNETVVSISEYIAEINKTLGIVADGDLRHGIDTEFKGEFAAIRESINSIVLSFRTTVADIEAAADLVLSGAESVSSSASVLAEGASEQASAIQELNATVDLLNQQTQETASNAGNADILSNKSTENAQEGNKEMQGMLESMEGIKDASDNISKIIKVIQDIAFQTNLLALNAAVEAARAGEHGKGFAVVAEEVRNLANRSENAAKDTASLIQDSISRVDMGTGIAKSTAESLNTIAQNAEEVSGLITKIATASGVQAEGISQVSTGLSQIAQVVQSNAATSQESAAASQELNTQAEMLRQAIATFKI